MPQFKAMDENLCSEGNQRLPETNFKISITCSLLMYVDRETVGVDEPESTDAPTTIASPKIAARCEAVNFMRLMMPKRKTASSPDMLALRSKFCVGVGSNATGIDKSGTSDTGDPRAMPLEVPKSPSLHTWSLLAWADDKQIEHTWARPAGHAVPGAIDPHDPLPLFQL